MWRFSREASSSIRAARRVRFAFVEEQYGEPGNPERSQPVPPPRAHRFPLARHDHEPNASAVTSEHWNETEKGSAATLGGKPLAVGIPSLDRWRHAKRASEVDSAAKHEKSPGHVARNPPARGKVGKGCRHEHSHTRKGRCEAQPSRELLHPVSVLRCGVELTLETRDVLDIELVF